MRISCDFHAIVMRILKKKIKSILMVHKNKKGLFFLDYFFM